VTLIRNVDYRDADVRLTAQRGEVQLDTGVGVFTGGSDGKSPARLVSERGEMTAQTIRYRKPQDLVLAEGGVRSQFQPAAEGGAGEPLPSTLLGDGEGPVWVESDSVQWSRIDNTSYFRGKVRAWRDRNLLQAEDLRAVPGEERLIASGGVKTVWFPARPAVEKDTAPPIGPGQRRGVAPTPAPQPLEVTAGSLDYLGKVGQVRYTDAVRIVDGPRRMECSEAEVKLAEDGGMESLVCLGNARLDDRGEGKVVMGERAVYDPVAKTIEVRGNPVTLKDRDGTQVEGRRVIYDLESGNARFLAAPAPGLRIPEEDTP
jgi:lipopolysaccharide transport protein LptA